MNRSQFTSVALIALVAATLSACSPAKWREVAPHTGDPEIENKTAPRTEPLKQGQPGYVTPERLRGRTDPSQEGKDAPVLLEEGDKITVVDPTPTGEDKQIKVVTPKHPEPIYVPEKYINDKPIELTQEQRDANKYFMIQNVATEKLRVYERCEGVVPETGKPCSHKLVLETDMVAGENTPEGDRQTVLGSFRISAWFKFYEDGKHNFPSWYHPGYPQLPPPGASWSAWLSRTLLPNNQGIARGKFGWYTAHVSPNAYAQWTHGTIGWGADKDRFIQLTRDASINEYADPRSAGCSRVENQAIAFIREILPKGTKIFKIYAREATRAMPSNGEQKRATWDWILTKDGYQRDGSKAGRAGALARGVTQADVLEQGTYVIDQTPDAVPFRVGANGPDNRNGNLYDVPETSMQGFFVVDEGRLVNYSHPQELLVGGYEDHLLPSEVVSHDTNVILPTGLTKQQVLQGDQPASGKLPDGTVVNEKPTAQVSEQQNSQATTGVQQRDPSYDLMGTIY